MVATMSLKVVALVLILGYCAQAMTADRYFDQLSNAELCARKRCGKSKPRGAMCTIVRDEQGRRQAKCFCPLSCSRNDQSPVCSIYGREYDNTCFLHLEACRKRRYIKVAYPGNCIASQAKCEESELDQFPFRLLAWFVHLRHNNEFGTIENAANGTEMTREERQEAAEWKFAKLDRNSNGELTQRELRNFRYALMPLEHCAKNFFKKCDENRDNKLQKSEWDSCFVLGAWEWYALRYQKAASTNPVELN